MVRVWLLRFLTIMFLFPAQPIPDKQSAVKGVAKFDFTADCEDELTLKVCVCVWVGGVGLYDSMCVPINVNSAIYCNFSLSVSRALSSRSATS